MLSLTVLLIALGSIFMFLSIIGFHRLMKRCRDETYKVDAGKKKIVYLACLCMMYAFLLGYAVVAGVVSMEAFQPIYFVVALIFFFGAIFVGAMVYALWIMNASLSKKNIELMELLVTSIEMKDLYTKGHSRHVCDVVELFYEYLPHKLRARISPAKVRDAALLHDIGKIGIPDAILNKPSKLDEKEWETMKLHPENGKFILTKTAFEEISDWVYYHHERMDGKGYYGIPAEQIPIEARMICIADAFSALNTDRVYRKRFSCQRTIEILSEASGTQFDPELLAYFKEIPHEDFERVYEKHKKDCADIFTVL